jgi:hypothetical protein
MLGSEIQHRNALSAVTGARNNAHGSGKRSVFEQVFVPLFLLPPRVVKHCFRRQFVTVARRVAEPSPDWGPFPVTTENGHLRLLVMFLVRGARQCAGGRITDTESTMRGR